MGRVVVPIRIRLAFILGISLMVSTFAPAQSIIGDVLAGKLVKPKVGQWAWYDLVDTQSKGRYVLRQAIVGTEDVGRETGYWLEIELVPEVGFPAFYKLLLTGPASNPANVHRVLVKEGKDPVQEMPTDGLAQVPETFEAPKQQSLGRVEVETPGGKVKAEHVILTEPDGAVEIWLNDEVRPTGIVRMRAAYGEMILRNHGEGGENAVSKLDQLAAQPGAPGSDHPQVKVEVVDEPDASRVEGETRADAPSAETP